MIKKCVLVDGIMEGGRPKPGDAVLVKSQGKLKDGRIIDDEPSMVFNIGDYEVIEGLDLVVQSMYKNELSIVSIKVRFFTIYNKLDILKNTIFGCIFLYTLYLALLIFYSLKWHTDLLEGAKQ